MDLVPSPENDEAEQQKLQQQMGQYLLERKVEGIEEILLRDADAMDHASMEVCFVDLHNYNATLALSLIYYPVCLLSLFEEALRLVQSMVAKHDSFRAKHVGFTVKPNLHIRIVSLPSTAQFSKASIGEIRADEKENFVQFSGTVVRTGTVRMLDVSKKYTCLSRGCGHTFIVRADAEQDNMLPSAQCPAVTDKGKCGCKNLREVEGSKICVDHQEIKVQDQIERLTLGSMPRSIIVILEADLADKCNAGDDVVIAGVLIKQWRPVSKGARCVVDIAIRANSIRALKFHDRFQVKETQNISKFRDFWDRHLAAKKLFTARDVIVGSVCPQLYGLFHVKLAVLLTLVGGATTSAEGGVRQRSQSHLLLVGDPGCGKSQILRFAAMVASRSVLTTGIGTTGAGLTCSMVRDGNEWTVEAGALVLSNDGVCCIDEFASIKEADRATIHEAMEQQTLSLAKAGLVVKLNTRTSVIACCNPKGSVYDLTADLTVNTAIAAPLLSRFDLVLVLLDTPEKEWDKRVSTFLLQQAVDDGQCGDSGKENTHTSVSRICSESPRQDLDSIDAAPSGANKAFDTSDLHGKVWKLGALRQYVNYVKHQFQPRMGIAAGRLLQKYYSLQREQNQQSSRTTVRLFESLVRLSEAHAKIMFRNEVEMEDAVVAISCVMLSQVQSFSLKNDSTLHAPFPTESEAFYQDQQRNVFALLHCSRASLEADEPSSFSASSSSSFSSMRSDHLFNGRSGFEERRVPGFEDDFPTGFPQGSLFTQSQRPSQSPRDSFASAPSQGENTWKRMKTERDQPLANDSVWSQPQFPPHPPCAANAGNPFFDSAPIQHNLYNGAGLPLMSAPTSTPVPASVPVPVPAPLPVASSTSAAPSISPRICEFPEVTDEW